jgi:hypothetical protein
LKEEGINTDVSGDDKLAEKFSALVLKNEGIPNGNGDTTPVKKDVVFGQYDDKNHGIDLVAADKDGNPIILEVKDYKDSKRVVLSDYLVKGEPDQPIEKAVQNLILDRKKQFSDMSTLKNPCEIRQMNDLWVRDRWLKLIKTENGLSRLRSAGVDEQFLDLTVMQDMSAPQWEKILDQRVLVIVNKEGSNINKRLLDQALFENRAKKVISIE